MILWLLLCACVLLLVLFLYSVLLLVRERLFLHRLTDYISSTTATNAAPHLVRPTSGNDDDLLTALETLVEQNRTEMSSVIYERQVLQHVLQHMTTGVVLLDSAGMISIMNDAAAKMFRQPVELCIGFEHWSIFRQHLSLSRAIDQTLSSGQSWHDEMELRPDLTVDVRLIAMQPVKSPPTAHYAHSVLLILTDVSQWRRLERMRSEFVANVSHELKTPITAIRGFAETLLDDVEPASDTAGFVQVIVSEANRMNALVADLLTLSKLEATEDSMRFENVELAPLIRRACETVQSEIQNHGLTLTVLPCDGLMVWGDADRLLQVLLNLLMNAVHYTPQGGSVELECEPLVDRVRVHVRDTGIGIPERHRRRVFERFYRVNRDRSRATGGTGLGLSIVKHIVNAHGGLVGVDGRIGKGSDFWFTIPLLSTRTRTDR